MEDEFEMEGGDPYTRGRWEGSNVTPAEVDWMYKSRHILAGVECRLPADEIEPKPKPGEFVVFTAHFMRGLGLPTSDFLRNFLNRYAFQPHHLPANAFFILSSFVAFCEGYIGLLPSLEIWAWLYSLQTNSIQDPSVPKPKPIVQCGTCMVVPRRNSPHVKMSVLESCRKWQRTFLYIKNTGSVDLINLPAYVPSDPIKQNWTYNPGESHSETNRICQYIERLRDEDMPSADDIVCTFIIRRVLPLQRRCHKICQMSGLMDPTRITTFELSKPEVVLKVKAIAKTEMKENLEWEWVLEPYSRGNPPPDNFRRQKLEAPAEYTADHTELDEEDPDSIQNTPLDEMDADFNAGSGKTPAPHSRTWADDASSDDDDCIILEVLEDTVPLTAQKTVAPKTTRTSKKVTPSETGPSAPPAKKRRKVGSQGPLRAKKRSRAPPMSSGPALEIRRSAPGRAPSAPKSTPTPPPEPEPEFQMPSPAKGKGSAASGFSSSSARPEASEGTMAPEHDDHHGGAGFTSAPEEPEDTGASDMGTNIEKTGPSESIVVPSAPESSIASPPPAFSKLASPSLPPASPKPASFSTTPPLKSATPLPEQAPPASSKPPAPEGVGKKKKVSTRKPPVVTSDELSTALKLTGQAPIASKAITLHTSRAAASIGDTVALQASQIVERSRSGQSLGSLEKYVDDWNSSDFCEVTSGLGKDREPVLDPRGPRSMAQQLVRLKRSMRENDIAWYDVDKNITLVLESRKKLYENLLWEHRELSDAHKALQAAHQKSQAEGVARPCDGPPRYIFCALCLHLLIFYSGASEKENLSTQHQIELQKQREETARLKDELIEMKLQHTRELQQAAEASQTELAHVRKELDELHSREMKEVQDRLHEELQAEKDLRDLEKKRNDALEEAKHSWAKIIEKLDEQPPSRTPKIETRKDELAPRAEHWNTEDHLTALAARVSYMEKLGKNLPDATILTFQNLWSGKKVPTRVEVLAARLNESGPRLTQWRRSSARSGADTALKFVCSCKFIPAPPNVEDFESEDEEDDEDEETEGSHSGDSEEVVDDEIEADKPPSQKSKPADPTPEDPASQSGTPESSSSEHLDAGAV
ncbi:hypothetical protein ACQ4PT_046893 [Festuca glaucescens]